jgi:hypothetical protein
MANIPGRNQKYEPGASDASVFFGDGTEKCLAENFSDRMDKMDGMSRILFWILNPES